MHVEPGRDNVNVRIRIDGVLIKIMSPPINSLNGILQGAKVILGYGKEVVSLQKYRDNLLLELPEFLRGQRRKH